MSKKAKGTGRRARHKGSDNLRAKRVDAAKEALAEFSEAASTATHMPLSVCAEYAATMITSDLDRQCASCFALHKTYQSVSFFFDPATGSSVFWSPCPNCMNGELFADDAEMEKLSDIAETTLLAWIEGSIEPQGLAIIFRPRKVED